MFDPNILKNIKNEPMQIFRATDEILKYFMLSEMPSSMCYTFHDKIIISNGILQGYIIWKKSICIIFSKTFLKIANVFKKLRPQALFASFVFIAQK